MNRKTFYAMFLLFAFSSIGFAQVKDTLTFRVYMGNMMKDNLFIPGQGDTVRVVGSFNNWSTTDTSVRMKSTGITDSVYTLTRILDSSSTSSIYDHNDTLFFKFYRTNRGGNYENIANNRLYGAIVNGHHSTPIYYFSDDSTVKPAVSVTFKVKMNIKMKENVFLPTSGDIVTVTGDFDGWNNSTDTLKMNAADSTFSKTVPFVTQATTIHYKFYKTLRAGLDWEGDQPTTSKNREYLVPVGGGSTPVPWFNNDSVFVPTITVNLLWQTDMSAMITLGWFNPATDSVDVRGAFTGWGSQKMVSNFVNTNIWQYTSQNLFASVGSDQSFKYYIRYKDSATIASKFAGYVWSGNVNGTDRVNVEDGIAYEHPITRGDGNDTYTITNSATQTPQRSWFSGINPFGLLANTDTVNVTLGVNMGPASRYSNPFDMAHDTLYLIWQDLTWWAAQAKIQGLANFTRNVKMTRRGATDSVWTTTFKVIGKTHYGMMYTFQYRQAAGTNQDQGGGLGGQNLFNVRFIPKTAGSWPKTYSAPTDVWQASAPLPFESAPFTTGVSDKISNVPLVYSLSQNYPNPFNPTTNILYSLPQQSNVKLRVYNILGQMVMELFNGSQVAGNHIVAFDASKLASGVYFYRLDAGSFMSVKKMVLLK